MNSFQQSTFLAYLGLLNGPLNIKQNIAVYDQYLAFIQKVYKRDCAIHAANSQMSGGQCSDMVFHCDIIQ